jgi:predicted nicotinamide N-methyase
MRSDPVSPQGRHTVEIGDAALVIETPPDLDALLDRAAARDPQAVDAIPYYAILWPAARGLAEHLWRHRSELAGARVIELGCGLGLPAILAAKLGAAVTATDFHPETGEWLRHNAALNGVTLEYRLLDWNSFLDEGRRHATCDTRVPPPTYQPNSLQSSSLIVGSDLVYERRHIPALVCAIDALVAPGGHAIISDPGRDNLALFVSAMEKSGWRHALAPEGDIYVCRFERAAEAVTSAL